MLIVRIITMTNELIPLQSPQTPRSFGHQSPTTNPNRSPAYVGQSNQIIQQVPNQPNNLRLNIGAGGGYAQAPGTPRPGFASDTARPTVYASNSSPYTSPRNEQFPQSMPSENNRQLRDLLQRQQVVTPNMQNQQQNAAQQQQMQMPLGPPQNTPPRWNPDGIDDPMQQQQGQQQGPAQAQAQPQQQQLDPNNTFRQPLPPGMVPRPQRIMGPQHQLLRPGGVAGQVLQQQHGPRGMMMGQEMRQRFRPPVGVIPAGPNGQQIIVQQGQTIIQQSQQYAGNVRMQQMIAGQQVIKTSGPMDQHLVQGQPTDNVHTLVQGVEMGQQQAPQQQLQPDAMMENTLTDNTQTMPSTESDQPEIPDNVTAELEKLEDENAAIGEVEGVGDILGDLGEDDDDELLNSLTAEIGADFNILEYADPELNEGDQDNLLDSLDFDDEPEKEKGKKDVIEKMTEELENKTKATALENKPIITQSGNPMATINKPQVSVSQINPNMVQQRGGVLTTALTNHLTHEVSLQF